MAKPVDYRETLVTYLNQDRNVKKPAEQLGITAVTLHGRLAEMRRRGVNIPKSVRHTNQLDTLAVAQLNSLVKKWNKDRQ